MSNTGLNEGAVSAGARKVAAIDLGTVSSRLSLAQVQGGAIVAASKHTEITDLGQGVDTTGRFNEAAVERVLAACKGFVAEARDFGAEAVYTTCTSAARDASNAGLLLGGLRGLGLKPQVIPGEIEARLTFFGVAHDFANERIAVADSGGGSTEIALGSYMPNEASLNLDEVQSLNIGCRRVTDRFLHGAPPSASNIAEARAWAEEQFSAYWEAASTKPQRLVAVGGTVTTLSAMAMGLKVYDSSKVHLSTLALDDVEAAIERMSSLSVEEIAALDGIQPKRAPVILGGALIIASLLRAGDYNELTVSENSLLAGMAATIDETLEQGKTTIGWLPELS